MAKRELSEEQKAELRERLAKARAAKGAVKTGAPPPEEPAEEMQPIVHEGAVPPAIIEDEGELPEIADPDAPRDDFETFLALQDAEVRSVLTDVELRVIYETEKKRANDERKERTKKLASARALRHARVTAGLLSPEAVEAAGLRDRLAKKVTWTVNMPEAGRSGQLIDAGVRIDGRLYAHGQRVTGTLAEYISYREIEWKAHQAELDFQGVGRLSRLRQSLVPDANLQRVA